MKDFSNKYIFFYISGVVVVTAALLSFVAEELRPLQQRNLEIEKKKDILRSVGKAESLDEVKNKNIYIENEFVKYFSSSIVVNNKGEKIEGKDAFEITKNLKAEFSKPENQRGLPLFIYSKEDGSVKYVIPMTGKGLWGQIWGYLALNDDFTTIYGAVFDHAKETPGLGAEINQKVFQKKFPGKKIFNENGIFVSIHIVKGGADPDDTHGVDAISGGTVTSRGLEAMIRDNLKPYEPYFKQQMIKSDE